MNYCVVALYNETAPGDSVMLSPASSETAAEALPRGSVVLVIQPILL